MRANRFESALLPPLQVMFIQVFEDETQSLALIESQYQRHSSEMESWTMKICTYWQKALRAYRFPFNEISTYQ